MFFSSFPSQLLALTLNPHRGRNQRTPLATLPSPRPCSPAPTPYAETAPLRMPSHAARSEAPATPRVVVNARLTANPFPAFHPAPPHPVPSLRPQFVCPCRIHHQVNSRTLRPAQRRIHRPQRSGRLELPFSQNSANCAWSSSKASMRSCGGAARHERVRYDPTDYLSDLSPIL